MLFKAEAAAGVLFGLLGVVTIFWRDWIEAIFGWDPDHHSGSLEWEAGRLPCLRSVA